MKLTKNQKHFLKTIKDKKIRKYQKQQFKLQNEFENRQIIKQFPFSIVDISFKEGFEKVNCKGFYWYKHSTKEAEEKFNELAKKYIPEENESTQKISCEIKSDEILSREKPKGIELNKEFLQETLDKSEDLKLCQDLKNICVKFQDYEYASKFRQKVWDILDTLSKEKLYELVRNGTILMSDFINSEKRKSDKLVEPKTEFTKEFCVEITEENRKILDIASIKRNSAGNRLIVGQFLVCNNEEFLLSDFRCCKLVTTQEFLKLIGREDLIKSKTVKLSELTFKTFNFSSANLSDLQIEKVIEWMNTWEQLKDTAIPIRFKEDFRIKK